MSNSITPDQEIAMSKRAYAKGFLNFALQQGVSRDKAKTLVKKASDWRRKAFSPEVVAVQEKRANAVRSAILERVAK